MPPRAHGAASSSSSPLRGGDHGARHAVPGVALAGDARRAPRAWRRAGPREPRARPRGSSASSRTAPGPTSNASQRARGVGDAARRACGRPRRGRSGAATTGSAPQAAASAATMPNASGNVLGTAIASAAAAGRRARRGRAGRPRRSGRSCARRGRPVGVAPRRRRATPGTPRRCGSSRAVLVARWRGPPRGRRASSAAASPRGPAEGAEADDQQPRRAARARARAARPPAAARRPWRRSACRRTPRAGRSGSTWPAPPPPRPVERANEDAVVGGLAPMAASALGSAASPARGRGRARAARSARRRRRAARGACGRATVGSSIAAHRLSAVWREPTRIPRAPREALARVRQEARVRLDRVLERAAVDLHRVRARRPCERAREDQRAHHQVVGERDVGPHALGDLAHRGDVALHVALELGVGEVRERARLDPVVAVGDVDGSRPPMSGR